MRAFTLGNDSQFENSDGSDLVGRCTHVAREDDAWGELGRIFSNLARDLSGMLGTLWWCGFLILSLDGNLQRMLHDESCLFLALSLWSPVLVPHGISL